MFNFMSKKTAITMIHITPDLDADFGNSFPEELDAYFVTVFSRKVNSKFKVIIIVPENSKLLNDVLLLFFKDYYKSKFIVEELTDDEIDSHFLNEIRYPIISYDPCTVEGIICFFWLYPPRNLMN